MGLKKGNYDNIDFRSYFRNNVFQHLNWISYRARNNSIQEETTGSFFIKILDHLYGNYTLRLTHDPRKNTRSYEQHNMMTHLHWGTACSIIANAELLNKHLRIYREVNNPQQFLIEIY